MSIQPDTSINGGLQNGHTTSLTNLDHSNNATKSQSHADTFIFDDLLVTVSREIIAKGYKSENIPHPIKLWIADKIISALPTELVKRLVNFLILHRDAEKITYKENQVGDELTLLVYRTERALKTRMQKLQEDIRDRENMNMNEYDKMFESIPKNIDLEENGLAYHADEIICEAANTIPANAIKSVDIPQRDWREKNAKRIRKDRKKKTGYSYEAPPPLDCMVGPETLKRKYPGDDANGSDEDFISQDTGEDDSDYDGSGKKKKKPRERPKVSFIYGTAKNKLKLLNEAHQNCYDDGIENCLTQSDEERLRDVNAIAEAMDDSDPDGDEVNLNSKKGLNVPGQLVRCDMCNRIYPGKKKGLLQHIEKMHPQDWPRYREATRIKSSRAKEIENYKEHYTIDPVTSKYVCLTCGRSHEHPCHMLKHIKGVHLKIKNFKCSLCGAEYFNKQHYEWHVQGHTGEKPYACDLCDKRFLREPKLMLHYKVMHPDTYVILKAEKDRLKAEQMRETAERKEREKEERRLARAEKRAEKRKTLPKRVRDRIDDDDD